MSLTDRVAKLLGEQPWPGYDEQDVGAIGQLDQRRRHGRRSRAMSATQGPRRVVEAAERRIDRSPSQPPLIGHRHEPSTAEGRAVPQRGARDRAGADARAAVADRDDPARWLPLRAGDASRSRRVITRERVAAAPGGAGRGLQPAHRRSSASPRASSVRSSRSARRRSTCCAAPAARRRCSRTPRTPAATEALEIATYTAIERLARARRRRRDAPSWPRRSSPTRSRCCSASCARSRS